MTILVRSASLQGYEALAHSLGLDPALALKRAQIPKRSLANPEALISYVAFIHLLEYSAAQSACPDFGLRLAQAQGLDTLGHLAVMLRHAPTLREALTLASRYIFIHSPAVRVNLLDVADQPDQVDVVFSLDIPGLSASVQVVELSLGLIVGSLRFLSGDRVMPLLVMLPHQQQAAPTSYAEAFGAACEFGSGHAAIRYRSAELDQALADHNPLLLGMAQSYLDQHFVAPEQQVGVRVRDMLKQFLCTGQVALDDIAQAMAVHPRTLQRRLAAEGLQFDALLDDVRREQLQDLIKKAPDLALSQIALMLGYTQQAALTRSCRRWFGCAPSALRQKV